MRRKKRSALETVTLTLTAKGPFTCQSPRDLQRYCTCPDNQEAFERYLASTDLDRAFDNPTYVSTGNKITLVADVPPPFPVEIL